MVKKFAYMLVLSIVLTGCSSPNLRVDDFRFGNKRVGLQAENPTFKAGEEVRLTFALRGFTADASGNGKATCKVTVSPDMEVGDQLPKAENQTFKINSEITSLEFRDSTFVIPVDASGDYELSVAVKDEVKGKEIAHVAPFKVEASQEGPASGAVDSLERKSELNRAKICANNLKLIETAIEMYFADNSRSPDNLGQLTPKYLVAAVECPVAAEDTYSASYKQDDSGYTLYCTGSHHSAAGLPANFPALRDGETVYR